MITFAQESWQNYYQDTAEIWRMHYDEIAGDPARMPMNPDVAVFQAMEQIGALQIVTARDAGRMVGYMVFFVRPHTHYCDVLCGYEDAYYLMPSHRKGWNGINLIKESLKLLKNRGVKRVFIHTKTNFDKGRLLKFLKLSHCDEIYSGWIADE